MEKRAIDDTQITQILSAGDENEQSRQEQKIRRNFWPTFKRALTQLPFAEDVATAYYCALDKETPNHVRGILLASLAYFVLPTDLIPDFIVGLGFSDDIAVLTTAFATLRNHMTDAQREAAKKALAELANDKGTGTPDQQEPGQENS